MLHDLKSNGETEVPRRAGQAKCVSAEFSTPKLSALWPYIGRLHFWQEGASSAGWIASCWGGSTFSVGGLKARALPRSGAFCG